MLHKDTLLSTNKGVLKASSLVVGVKVPTSSGWCTLTSVWKSKVFNRKFKIETEIGSVIVDERQHFFQDNDRVNVLRLRTGSLIDTFYGSKKIIKMTQFIDRYGKYFGVQVASFDSSFYIHNGIMVSY